MNSLIRRARGWMPAAKAAALFVLPATLFPAIVAALVRGDAPAAALTGGSLASLWSAGTLAAWALAAEARYFLGERADPPAIPLKLLSAALTAIGVSLAAIAGGNTIFGTLIFALLGALGHVAFYGRDLRSPRIRVAEVAGVDRDAVTLQLKQAYARLRGIEAAGRALPAPEFRDRLERITGIGRTILGEIERDPSDASRARKFLNVYLDGAEKVTVEYARTHRAMRSQPLEPNFRQLLAEMETTFAEQHRRLLEREVMSLDVDIEVLNTRLKREGLG